MKIPCGKLVKLHRRKEEIVRGGERERETEEEVVVMTVR